MAADAYTHTDPPPEAELVLPRAGRLIGWLALGAVLVLAALVALPDRPYLRFQALSKTIHFRVQWSYERIHFDPTPIDIAVIGNSRMGAGVDAPDLGKALSERLGRPVNVVNLSTPQEGRNIHWVMARELIETRPEVSMILLSVIEQAPREGHPAFASLATRDDILAAPALVNRDWLNDLLSLPYRQLSLFVKGLAPGRFGMAPEFDVSRYRGPDYDTTVSFALPDGHVIDRDSVVPEPELRAAARPRILSITPPKLPAALSDYEFAVERSYTRRIAELAREHGVGVGFIYLPIYTNEAEIRDLGFYTRIGPVFQARQMIDAWQYFSDYGHANHAGALALVPWLADAIAAEVGKGALPLKPPAR